MQNQFQEFTDKAPEMKSGDERSISIVSRLQMVNQRTVMDSYSLPNIHYFFMLLIKAEYFSLFDAMNGYWQAELDEESCDITGFTTMHGLYRWKHLGLLMERVGWVKS